MCALPSGLPAKRGVVMGRWLAVNLRMQNRLPALDGWRGISILCVLAGHMLPLGPKALDLNEAVAAVGMSIFFTLSGFLIVSMLARDDNVASFLIRRTCRILPLAWAFLVVVLALNHATLTAWAANILFYANLPPFYLDYSNGHFWSLCIEVQFYAAIALAVAVAGRSGLILVPIVCVAVTLARIIYGVHISIVTWWRVDEILTGGCLALIVSSKRLPRLPAITPLILAPLLLLSAHPQFGPINYARPYLAAILVGSTIRPREDILQRLLCSRPLAYIAEISYALYVIHPLTYAGWLGEGDTAVRYLKRIGSFAMCFAFAHISTRHFERHFIQLGRRLTVRLSGQHEDPLSTHAAL
jgi:peptidoglycan/LPS O-acetylase OafA/YrhL